MATFTSGAGLYTLILNVNEVGGSSNITNNTSNVSWSLQLRADRGYCQWNPGPGDFEVRIDGALVWSAQNPSLWYSGYPQTLTIASGTRTVGHNSDGSKTVYCEGKYIANSTANYLPSSSTCGGNLGLSTIPRASSFDTITGDTIGDSQTINISRKSSSFTHNLWYKVGNGEWTSIGTGIGTSKTWTIPLSLNNQIPNSTTLTLTYLLRTYNGSAQIGGDVTKTFNVNYSGQAPSAGTTSINYTNLFNNEFIANYSIATISYSGYGGVYGSTVKSAQISFNGSWRGTTEYSTGRLTAGTYNYQGVVTDSRGKTAYSTQKSFTCYQINNPSISINAYRSDAEGNASPTGTYLTIIPTYSAHNPVGGNSIKSNSFTCTTLMTAETTIASGAKKILPNAIPEAEYVISGTVTDQLGRTSATSLKVGTGFTLWDVRPDQTGMAFGRYSTGANKFEVAWPAHFDGGVISSSVYSKYYYKEPFCIQDTQTGSVVNTWHKVADIKISYQYQDCSLKIYLEWMGHGLGNNLYATLSLRVKQQDVMGNNPSIELIAEKSPNTSVAYNCFAVTKVQYSSSLTHLQLWVKNPMYYSNIRYYYENGITETAITLNTNTSYQTTAPSNIIQYSQDRILNLIYPVGSVYTSVISTNPSSFIGGTWVQFGQGRTLVGVNTSDGDFNTVEKTGGKKTRRLNANIGAYDSMINKIGYEASDKVGNGFSYGIWGNYEQNIASNRVNHGTVVYEVGNGDKNIPMMPPYVTVYFWKRTA